MDPVSTSPSPAPGGLPSPSAPPDAGMDPRAAADAEIQRIRADKSHPYHRSNAAAIDAMNALYFQRDGQPDPDMPNAEAFTRPSAPYDLDLPDDVTEAVLPTVLKQDIAATVFNLGLDRQTGSAAVRYALGLGPEPSLPERRTSFEASVRHLQDEHGQDFERQLMHYNAGVAILDARRAQAGHPPGEIRAFLKRSGYDNDPATVNQLARIGHWYRREAPTEFRAFAAHWARQRTRNAD